MKLLFPYAFIFALCSQWVIAQDVYLHDDNARRDQGLRVMFYNVENLFDTIDDPLTIDEEYLPESELKWTTDKYWDKTTKIAQVIAAVGGMELPSIIGFCEIENRLVLENLTKVDPIKNANYQVVHYDSPDRRGIDVGLLYRPDKFRLLFSENLAVTLDDDITFFTRDVLYVKGLLFNEDTIHIYVNHWPSRRGGQATSDYKRVKAASMVRQRIDSLRGIDSEVRILVMGDFNDGPSNNSLAIALGGKKTIENSETDLMNFMKSMDKDLGTHKYRGEWEYLDQFLVSQSLLTGNWQVKNHQATVFRAPFLLEKDERYTGDFPIRAFRGPRYVGGFSDHLPIFLDLIKNQHIDKN
ncbi:MAG: hypothetical protein LAT76_04465 [Schleiferiaceae bacterium]|nr:hypothetical protein [Schleiferiaceae bacterium]